MFSRILFSALFFLALLQVSFTCIHRHSRQSRSAQSEETPRRRDHVVKQKSSVDQKENISEIVLAKSYHATGLLTLPYDGIMEPFEVWFAQDYNMSRIDYYHGVDKTYQRGDLEQYGAFIKEIPIHRTKVGNNKQHGTLCWYKKGTMDDIVKPQSVVPLDLTHYKVVDEEYRSGTLTIKLQRHVMTGNLNNTFTLWITKSKPHRPIRYETKGFDLLLSGYFDHYYMDYVTFNDWRFDFEVMKIPTESFCHYAARKSTSRYLVNPMSEFVHHSHEIPKHYKVLKKSFKHFKRKHKKNYDDEKEHTKRRNIYRHNARFVRSKNRARLNYTLALNHLADLSPEEFTIMNDLLDRPDEGMQDSLQDQFPKRGEVPAVSCCVPPKQPLPKILDWREYDVISPIRGQSMCGSCWAFSTIGMLEGAYKIATGKDIQLSAQMLVDCTYGFKNYGCRGGWPWKAMQWVIRNGIATKESYGRYLAQEGECHCGPQENCTIIHPTGFGDMVAANKTAMTINLAKYGPVSVGINSSPKSFKFYRKGVYDDMDCDERTEHSVLIVGYGEESDGYGYWIIKNSWGPFWGREGYMRIASDDDICGILTSNGVVANFRNDTNGFPFERMKKVETPHNGDIEDHLKKKGLKPIFEPLPFN